jgi:beta-glucosidase
MSRRRIRDVVCAAAVTLAAFAPAAFAPPTAAAAGRCGSYAWCETSLSPDQRAHLFESAMTQSDKIGILTGQAASDVGLPAITWTDGGLGAGGLGSGSSGATAMPASIALAANFDPAMASRYGAVVGAEVKHRGFDGDYGPTVNIMRTPLGGRTFEAYGEDPFVAAQTAVGWIDGFQAQGVMADVKHFAANNQEGQLGVSPLFGVYGGRSIVNARVDARTLHEIEFPAFEAAVTKAHSATVMCSYNLVNGRYACASPFLLGETLRKLWGFNGFVLSDALACHETDQNLNAGLNFDIAGSCYTAPEVDAALAAGLVSQATLDARVIEILRTLFAFGFFDHPTWPKDPAQDAKAADTVVADRAEQGGSVLLRNDGVLPIDPKRVHSIAVIGPAASQYIYGNGSSQVKPYSTTTALQGIVARAGQAHITVTYDDATNTQSAQALAKNSDLAIVVAADTESEGYDKTCMSLTPVCSPNEVAPTQQQSTQAAFGDQDSLIQTIAAANKRTVVVLQTGAPVLTPWRDSLAGLLEAWYPGEDGGTAIAHVLFGDADPGGRLPATFPRSESDIPTASGGMARYPGTVNPTTNCDVYATVPAVPCPFYQEDYSEGVMVGYRWYDSQRIVPAYPFGFGLSYTSFRYSDLTIHRGADPVTVTASVTVTNTASRKGWALPELYVSLPSLPGVPEPPWQLKGFTKLELAPGESQRVSMPLDMRAFSYWSDADNGWRIAPGCDRIAVGSSSRDLPLAASIAQGGASCPPDRGRHPASCGAAHHRLTTGVPHQPSSPCRTDSSLGGPLRATCKPSRKGARDGCGG